MLPAFFDPQGRKKGLGVLLTMAGCAWGTEHIFGGAGGFSRVKLFIREMSVPVSPALFLDTIFLSFCNTVIPFVQFGVLVGKTQDMDVLELLTLKAALNALSPKLGSVQCKHSFTKILCLMNKT